MLLICRMSWRHILFHALWHWVICPFALHVICFPYTVIRNSLSFTRPFAYASKYPRRDPNGRHRLFSSTPVFFSLGRDPSWFWSHSSAALTLLTMPIIRIPCKANEAKETPPPPPPPPLTQKRLISKQMFPPHPLLRAKESGIDSQTATAFIRPIRHPNTL